jgi:hypothetical protein
LEGSEQSFQTALQNNYNTNFASQQGILANLNQTLAPIAEAGPNQTGFSAPELAALNTQAINTTGANYANAERAIQTQTAGRNDSGNLPESGVDQALKAQTASAAASQLSQEQLGITEANYATGRSNFNNAVGGEEALAGQYNPVATGGLANNANQQAFGEATEINQQENQEQADIFGGVTSLVAGIPSLIKSYQSLGGGGGKSDQSQFGAVIP